MTHLRLLAQNVDPTYEPAIAHWLWAGALIITAVAVLFAIQRYYAAKEGAQARGAAKRLGKSFERDEAPKVTRDGVI